MILTQPKYDFESTGLLKKLAGLNTEVETLGTKKHFRFFSGNGIVERVAVDFDEASRLVNNLIRVCK